MPISTSAPFSCHERAVDQLRFEWVADGTARDAKLMREWPNLVRRQHSVSTEWIPPEQRIAPLAETGRSNLTWQAHGPPREGPPIILLKHAFLI